MHVFIWQNISYLATSFHIHTENLLDAMTLINNRTMKILLMIKNVYHLSDVWLRAKETEMRLVNFCIPTIS